MLQKWICLSWFVDKIYARTYTLTLSGEIVHTSQCSSRIRFMVKIQFYFFVVWMHFRIFCLFTDSGYLQFGISISVLCTCRVNYVLYLLSSSPIKINFDGVVRLASTFLFLASSTFFWRSLSFSFFSCLFAISLFYVMFVIFRKSRTNI